MEEAGMELNITDSGKKLGLRSLSEALVDLVWDEIFTSWISGGRAINYATMKQEDFKLELSRMVEKRIVEYFTEPQ